MFIVTVIGIAVKVLKRRKTMGSFIRGIFCIGLTSRISPFERYFNNFIFYFPSLE